MYYQKVVIKNADMSEEMQQDSVECATQAMEKYNIEKDIAAHTTKAKKGEGVGRGVGGGGEGGLLV
uniref:Dynein light chain n=1 Tax=Mus spicilegus TaxID=10103 RepID=A0A8C6GL35_MUSSI